MNKRIFLGLSLALLAIGCGNGADGSRDTGFFSGKDEDRPVYENQDRNGSCWETGDCMAGLTCQGAQDDVAGTCQKVCAEDADCGNGFLCRSGDCQKDCAELGEKCSERRVCCFVDQDNDRKSDSLCVPDENEDHRCSIQSGVSVSAEVEAAVD